MDAVLDPPDPSTDSLAQRDSGSTGRELTDAAAAAAHPPEALVVLDRPYRRFERPRAAGPVQASVEDETLARWNVGGTGDPAFVSNRGAFHPGARVVVDVSVAAREPRLPQRPPKPNTWLHRVLAQARKHGYWPFRLCFEDGLRIDSKLHGRTEIAFTLDSSGRVQSPRLVRTRLEAVGVASCLVERTAALLLGAAGQKGELLLSVDLWPGDAPVLETTPPPEQASIDQPPALSWQALLAVARRAEPDLRVCYERGLGRNPGLWGRMEILVVQSPSGKVGRLTEHQSRFPDRQAASCVLETLRRLPWPRPDAGRTSWVLGVRFGRPPSVEPDKVL